jgi:GAF domain-containing protein
MRLVTASNVWGGSLTDRPVSTVYPEGLGGRVTSRQEWAEDRTAFGRGEGAVLGPLARQFTELTRRLLPATTVVEVLDQVVRAAAELVPGADMVSVTLRSPDGGFHTPVETDQVASRLDQLQYATGEGPCIDAARAGGSGHVRCEDLTAEPAWPTFGPLAAEHGVRSVLAIALLPEVSVCRYSGALTETQLRRAIESRDVIGQAEVAALLATHHTELDYVVRSGSPPART